MSQLVEARDLTKVYGSNVLAVNHLNLTLEGGKIIGLLGPNGSGKTTFIKMLNGLLVPTAGEILVNGLRPGVESKAAIAYLPDKTYLQNDLRISEIIDFFQDFYQDFSKEKAYSMLQSLGLNPKQRLRSLSKGNKEKVQLILVMSRNAKLYVLDEPIAGVDPAARDYILRTIIQNYSEEATILLSTHLISDIETILDEVIFIKNGQLLLHSSVDDIREKQGKSIDAYFREVFAC